jgi:hypothetical protein
MAEQSVWRGGGSQWKNLGFFLLHLLIACAIMIIFAAVWRDSSPEIQNFSPSILLLLALPIFIAGMHYLQTKCAVYEVTNDRGSPEESDRHTRVLSNQGY